MSQDKRPSRIYYDGTCPMCTVFADTVSSKDKNALLLDANISEQLPASKAEIMSEIYMIDQNGITRTGPDAIMTSLSDIYPWLSSLTKLVRLPIINSVARFTYFFISKRRKLWFGGNKPRLFWLFLITNLGLLSGIILSWPLWIDSRTYPAVPIIDYLDFLSPLTLVFSLFLVTNLAFSFFITKYFRLLSWLSVLIIIPLVILDITRLQPWLWHYFALLFLFTWWKNDSEERDQKLLDAAKIIIVGIYFWSGLQKMNVAFFTEIFPWFVSPISSNFGDIGLAIAILTGLLVPFIETGFALGLLTLRFRKISLIGSGLMLILVLTSLISQNWNNVVWPWNLVIFAMVIALFYRSKDTLREFLSRLPRNGFALVAILFFIIMPSGNITDKIDHYLSWSLYSGHVPTAKINASQETLTSLSPGTTATSTLNFERWSIETLNVVPYPEVRTFKEIFASICQKYPTDKNLNMVMDTREFFMSHRKTETLYRCQ